MKNQSIFSRWLSVAAFVIAAHCAFAQDPLRKWIPSPSPDSLATGYYVVDSDDPTASAPYWRPRYDFVDTNYQRSTWHRIYAGPRSIPASDPNAVCWRSLDGDTTDNTFAGPIPIGFSFNFYGVNYDSVYLSSNGFIGFGNYSRASGGDGPSFATHVPGPLPNIAAPKAIAAFMMTDGEMVRAQDSSRVLYRTTPANDSLLISIYRYYHISGNSTAGTIHKYYVDVQIVLSRADSGITFNYRKFYGVVVFDIEGYSAEPIFRNGCIPQPCSSNAGVIGIQSSGRTNGTTYMANGVFTAPSTVVDLHSGLAVRFHRWRNIAQTDSILWPPRNFELMIGDTLVPQAVYGNVSPLPQTVLCSFRLRNIATGKTVFLDSAVVSNLASGATQRVTFRSWRSDTANNEQVGTMIAEAMIRPYIDDTHLLSDGWPFDDTIHGNVFVFKRVNTFIDYNNGFTLSNTLATGQSENVIVECSPTVLGTRHATLWIRDTTPFSISYNIPLTYTADSAGIILPSEMQNFGDTKIGTGKILQIPVNARGSIPDTIVGIATNPISADLSIHASTAFVLPGVPTSLTAQYNPIDTGSMTTIVTITTNPCHIDHLITYTGHAVFTTSVARSSSFISRTPHLAQNRPNPFSDNTTIDFDLAERGRARLVITDMLGRTSAVVCDEILPAGNYSRLFSTGALPVGAYSYTLHTRVGIAQKMLFIRR